MQSFLVLVLCNDLMKVFFVSGKTPGNNGPGDCGSGGNDVRGSADSFCTTDVSSFVSVIMYPTLYLSLETIVCYQSSAAE